VPKVKRPTTVKLGIPDVVHMWSARFEQMQAHFEAGTVFDVLWLDSDMNGDRYALVMTKRGAGKLFYNEAHRMEEV
jgi:hypothetical protein